MSEEPRINYFRRKSTAIEILISFMVFEFLFLHILGGIIGFDYFQHLSTSDWYRIFLIPLFYSFPVTILLKNYSYSKSKDYLIVAGFFICVSLQMYTSPLTLHTPNFILNYGNLIFSFLSILIIFIHALRYRWENIKVVILSVSVSSFILITLDFLILFISNFTIIEHLVFLFIKLPPEYEKINPFTPYTRLDMLTVIRFLMGLVFLYSYLKTPLFKLSTRVTRVRRLMLACGGINLIAASSFIFDTIFVIIQSKPLHESLVYLDIIAVATAGVLFFFIAIYYPESMLISHIQILRVIDTYNSIPMNINQPIKTNDFLEYLHEVSVSLKRSSSEI